MVLDTLRIIIDPEGELCSTLREIVVWRYRYGSVKWEVQYVPFERSISANDER